MNKKRAMLGLATLTMSSAMYTVDAKALEVVRVEEGEQKIVQNNKEDLLLTTDNLNLRQSPEKKDGNIILTMKAGSKVTLISKDGEWAKVKFGNKEGFASLDYLEEVGVNAKTGVLKKSKVNTAVLNVRAGASTSYKIIGAVRRDTVVDVYAFNNAWTKINYNGKEAYVSSKYLVDVKEESVDLNKEMEIHGANSLNIRSGPGNNYSIKGKLKRGDKINVLSMDNGWARFKYKNADAYVSVEYLKEIVSVEDVPPQEKPTIPPQETPDIPSQEKPVEINKEMMVSVHKTNVRNGEGTSYAIAGVLNQNDKIMVVRQMPSGWSEVIYKNKTAYVLTNDLKEVENIPNTPPSETQVSNLETFKQDVLNLVNAERAKEGLGALVIDSNLSNVAQLKSRDMIDKDYFDHNSPTYGTPFDMMRSFGITYRVAGENIAMGHSTPEEVVEGWMNSAGHRKNIMNPRFTHLGMGIDRAQSGRIYWTQMFTGQK